MILAGQLVSEFCLRTFIRQAPMQADQHLHASYVDRIVATLGATVKTGTGVARKTPVQLNDGSWVSAISVLMEWAWSINV